MIIKQLVMKNFGRFAYKDISLREGMNIVYGVNEAGKSTVHSFVRGMLFGMEKKRGRASKDNLYDSLFSPRIVFDDYLRKPHSGSAAAEV